jgi:Outer membrane protein beta-barrel domain
MKKYLLISVLVICARSLSAQHSSPTMALNLYGGYTFPDHIDMGYYNNYNNYGYINGSGQYGGSLEFFLHELRSIELSYQYFGANVPFYDYLGQTNPGKEKASAQYILIGGNNYFPTNSSVLPYGGLGIGVGITNFNYYSNESNSATKFAWNLRVGVKIKTASALSIKLQAYLQSIAQGAGVGVGFGTGGAGAGVTTYSTMLQFGLGGGLSFAFGGKH